MKTEGGGKKVQKKKEEMKGESKNARTVVVCVDVLLCCCFRGGDPAAIVLFLSRSSLSLSVLSGSCVFVCARDVFIMDHSGQRVVVRVRVFGVYTARAICRYWS